MEKFRNVKLLSEMMESVLILRNSFLKLKTVVDNAILLNYAVSSENISESIKIKTENWFNLKVNVCIFHRKKNSPDKISNQRHFWLQENKKWGCCNLKKWATAPAWNCNFSYSIPLAPINAPIALFATVIASPITFKMIPVVYLSFIPSINPTILTGNPTKGNNHAIRLTIPNTNDTVFFFSDIFFLHLLLRTKKEAHSEDVPISTPGTAIQIHTWPKCAMLSAWTHRF